jgi:hypothetical protein
VFIKVMIREHSSRSSVLLSRSGLNKIESTLSSLAKLRLTGASLASYSETFIKAVVKQHERRSAKPSFSGPSFTRSCLTMPTFAFALARSCLAMPTFALTTYIERGVNGRNRTREFELALPVEIQLKERRREERKALVSR